MIVIGWEASWWPEILGFAAGVGLVAAALVTLFRHDGGRE